MADPGEGSMGSGPPYQTWGVFCFLHYPSQNHLHDPPKCTFQILKSQTFSRGGLQTLPSALLVITQYCRLLPKIIPLLHIFGKNPGTPPIKIPGSAPANIAQKSPYRDSWQRVKRWKFKDEIKYPESIQGPSRPDNYSFYAWSSNRA